MTNPDYIAEDKKIVQSRLGRYTSQVRENLRLNEKISAAEVTVVLLAPHHIQRQGDNKGYELMLAISKELETRGIFATPVKPISEKIKEAPANSVGDSAIETADILAMLHLNSSAPSQAYGDEVGNVRRNATYCDKSVMLVPTSLWPQVLADSNYHPILKKFQVGDAAIIKESADIIENQVKGLIQIALNKKTL